MRLEAILPCGNPSATPEGWFTLQKPHQGVAKGPGVDLAVLAT
jgi:hypothetical protein